MHLLLRRTQRDDGWIWSSMTFLLDLRLDLTPDEQHLFEKYNLGPTVVYDSDAREQAIRAAEEHFDQAEAPPKPRKQPENADEMLSQAFADMGTTLWHNLAGTAYGLMSWLHLRITLRSLADGQHVESQSLEEIECIAASVRGAVDYLASYLDVAVSYDGREQLDEL